MDSAAKPVAARRPDSPPGAGGRRASAFGDWRGLAVWLATRLGVVAVASYAAARYSDPGLKHSFLDRWTQWDVGHLITIAHYGYAGDPSKPRDGGLVAFFPGFPLLLRAVHLAVPDWRLAALLISLVAGAFAAMALTRMVDAEIPSAGIFATLAMLLSPFAVFLFAGYSEALFLAFAFPAWGLARQRRWEAAALCGLAAGTVRITGLFLAIALVIEFLRVERLRWRTMPWMLLPFAGVVGYFAYLWWWSGDMMAWQHAQATHWGRTFTNPLDSLHTTWNAAFGPHDMFTDAFRVELAAAAIGVALTCWLLIRRRWAESAYVGLQMISFLTSSYYLSIGRATLLWWPLWMMLGGLAVRTRNAPFAWRLPVAWRPTVAWRLPVAWRRPVAWRLPFGRASSPARSSQQGGADVREGWGDWPVWAYCLRLGLYVAILCAMVSLLVVEIVHFTEGGWAG